MRRGLQKRHLDPAFAVKLRCDQLVHHGADVLGRQRRVHLLQNLAGVVGVLVDELHRLAPRDEDGAQFVGMVFDQIGRGDAGCGGSNGNSVGPMMTWYLLSPPRIMNRMPGMLVASTT